MLLIKFDKINANLDYYHHRYKIQANRPMHSEKTRILYLGDTSLEGAAGYLAGLLNLWTLPFDYIPSHLAWTPSSTSIDHRLFILSDYPSNRLKPPVQQEIQRAVAAGAGLLMIGGWESYCGAGGDWAGTTISELLPVEISRTDDRANCDQPALLACKRVHVITDNLPWNDRPPTVGGYNRFIAKPAGEILLEVERFQVQHPQSGFRFVPIGRDPMLVVGAHGQGRTAALATDLAPHWVGGLVDWGASRVTAQAPGSWNIEVGDLYAKFIRQLIHWTGNF
jgi:hypothetical protein